MPLRRSETGIGFVTEWSAGNRGLQKIGNQNKLIRSDVLPTTCQTGHSLTTKCQFLSALKTFSSEIIVMRTRRTVEKRFEILLAFLRGDG